MRPEMIEPVDKRLTMTDAKTIYRKYLKEFKVYDDRQDLAQAVRSLSEDIKRTEEEMRDVLYEYKCQLALVKTTLREIKKNFSSYDEDEQHEFDREIEDAEQDVQETSDEIETTKRDLADFRKDKRLYLVDYMNSELHSSTEDSMPIFFPPNK